jgi:hypothetical protein
VREIVLLRYSCPMKYISIAVPLLALLARAASAQNVDALIGGQLSGLVTTYEDRGTDLAGGREGDVDGGNGVAEVASP